jgi:enoyl-CoA hydratase
MGKVHIERTMNDIIMFTIQRPEVRNAIDYDVMEELDRIIEVIHQDLTIKALIITGSGSDAFCSGGDLSIFHQLYTKEESYSMLSKMGNILYKLLTLNRPTFALLNGFAIGGGCELATACDFRIARDGTKMGFVQGSLAITTGWGGGTMLLEKLPHDQAYKLLFSATTYSASEANGLSFINKVLCEDDWKEEGIRWIEGMVQQCSAPVLSSYKNIAINKWKLSKVKERMLDEIKSCASLWEKEEHHRSVKAFLEKKES